MLITFKSPASGDVIMFEKNAKEALGVLGKDPEAHQGIVTVDQLPGAIVTLKTAMAADKGRPPEPTPSDDEDTDQAGGGVGFAQRAVPLLELLEHALKEEAPVTWGV